MTTTLAIGLKMMKTSRGLTLVELILVMTIMLVLMALVAPRLNGFGHNQVLRSRAETVLAMLRTAQTRASTEGKVYRVSFDANKRTIKLEVSKGESYEELKTSDNEKIELPEDFTIKVESASDGGEIDELLFQPTGEVTPARITLTDSKDNLRYIYARTPLEQFALAGRSEKDNTLP